MTSTTPLPFAKQSEPCHKQQFFTAEQRSAFSARRKKNAPQAPISNRTLPKLQILLHSSLHKINLPAYSNVTLCACSLQKSSGKEGARRSYSLNSALPLKTPIMVPIAAFQEAELRLLSWLPSRWCGQPGQPRLRNARHGRGFIAVQYTADTVQALG